MVLMYVSMVSNGLFQLRLWKENMEYPLILYIVQENNIKKVFKSNKIVQNIDVHYEFYKDYLIEKNENGEMKVEYSKLDEIIETKTNFYLMIAKNQGYMISKADMPSGLDEFIKKMRKA